MNNDSEKGTQWRTKMQSILDCQSEIKRTTQMGKKMLSASKVNTCLRESFEELGKYTSEAIFRGELQWENHRAQQLIQTIQECQKTLEEIESEMNNIKFPKR